MANLQDKTVIPLDVRGLPCALRKTILFQHFDDLRPGEAMEIINDHDPAPLRARLAERGAEAFVWDYVETGPEVWQVRVVRS